MKENVSKKKWFVGYSDGSGIAHGVNARYCKTDITAFDDEVGIQREVLTIKESEDYDCTEIAKAIVDYHNKNLIE